MPPRRQRTEPRTSPTPEEGTIVEVPETQPQTEIQIPIRNASERGPSPNQISATGAQDPVVSSEDVDMTDTPVEALENLTADQLEERLTAIEAERRRAHLRLKLAEAEAEREAGFPIAAAQQAVSEPFRMDPELQAALSLEKGLKSKAPDDYSGDTQKSFDRYIRECTNE